MSNLFIILMSLYL